MKYFLVALLFVMGGALGACNSSPATNNQLITGDHPMPTDSVVAVDAKASPVHGPVPFVNPTKIGRTLGPRTPSPPASRTH
ncbi:hypothetical protein [Hymenobacter rubidus]|uniref:hypothetical protein n=1 Tax=Hymenobacter rubidus TaxID=1441626 RepID=UPI00191DAFE8|nr:hypothetical protein [Hymenobacter rubidus]